MGNLDWVEICAPSHIEYSDARRPRERRDAQQVATMPIKSEAPPAISPNISGLRGAVAHSAIQQRPTDSAGMATPEEHAAGHEPRNQPGHA